MRPCSPVSFSYLNMRLWTFHVLSGMSSPSAVITIAFVEGEFQLFPEARVQDLKLQPSKLLVFSTRTLLRPSRNSIISHLSTGSGVIRGLEIKDSPNTKEILRILQDRSKKLHKTKYLSKYTIIYIFLHTFMDFMYCIFSMHFDVLPYYFYGRI